MLMKKLLVSLAACAALSSATYAADPIRLGPAQANNHKFADWPEEVSAGFIEHAGGTVALAYAVSASGEWNGRAQVTLRDAAGHAVAGLRGFYDASNGSLTVEALDANSARPLAAREGLVKLELPAGRYSFTGCRATCPLLPENDVVGGPVSQAITLEATVR
jgi:hypothetical protein